VDLFGSHRASGSSATVVKSEPLSFVKSELPDDPMAGEDNEFDIGAFLGVDLAGTDLGTDLAGADLGAAGGGTGLGFVKSELDNSLPRIPIKTEPGSGKSNINSLGMVPAGSASGVPSGASGNFPPGASPGVHPLTSPALVPDANGWFGAGAIPVTKGAGPGFSSANTITMGGGKESAMGKDGTGALTFGMGGKDLAGKDPMGKGTTKGAQPGGAGYYAGLNPNPTNISSQNPSIDLDLAGYGNPNPLFSTGDSNTAGHLKGGGLFSSDATLGAGKGGLPGMKGGKGLPEKGPNGKGPINRFAGAPGMSPGAPPGSSPTMSPNSALYPHGSPPGPSPLSSPSCSPGAMTKRSNLSLLINDVGLK
jgi:hypothetical protein